MHIQHPLDLEQRWHKVCHIFPCIFSFLEHVSNLLCINKCKSIEGFFLFEQLDHDDEIWLKCIDKRLKFFYANLPQYMLFLDLLGFSFKSEFIQSLKLKFEVLVTIKCCTFSFIQFFLYFKCFYYTFSLKKDFFS